MTGCLQPDSHEVAGSFISLLIIIIIFIIIISTTEPHLPIIPALNSPPQLDLQGEADICAFSIFPTCFYLSWENGMGLPWRPRETVADVEGYLSLKYLVSLARFAKREPNGNEM